MQLGIDDVGRIRSCSPERSISRISLALGLRVRLLRARGGDLRVHVAELLRSESVVLLVPTKRLELERNSSTFASASATF